VANETTYTTFSDASLAAAVANEHILQALYDNNFVDQLTRRVNLAGVPSKSHDVALWPRLAAATVGEGVDLTATNVNSSKVTVTVAEQGIMVVPTDALNLSSLVSIQEFAAACAEAVREKQLGDVAALASGFSSTVGTTTVNLTEQNIMDAIATLAINRYAPPYYGLLYPQQWMDYMASVGSTFTPASGTGAAGSRAETNDWALMAGGFQRDSFGCYWLVSTAVPTATAGADSAGMLVKPDRAIARGVKYESRTEVQRDASLRATEVVVTAFDGVVEIEDAAGVGIITDR